MGKKRLVSYLAVLYSLSLIKHTVGSLTPPSGMVVYVLRPDRIVVCFRRREGRSKEEGLVCSAMLCSALLAVASMS